MIALLRCNFEAQNSDVGVNCSTFRVLNSKLQPQNIKFRDENSELQAQNTNIRDPRVNDGEWKAMLYSLNSKLRALNSNIRDPRLNDSESGAIAFVIIPFSQTCNLKKHKFPTKLITNILRRGTTLLCPDITVHPSQYFICNFP